MLLGLSHVSWLSHYPVGLCIALSAETTSGNTSKLYAITEMFYKKIIDPSCSINLFVGNLKPWAYSINIIVLALFLYKKFFNFFFSFLTTESYLFYSKIMEW